MLESIPTHRILLLIALLGLVFTTSGGTCVVVEEGMPGALDGPGENEEVMRQQEEEVMEPGPFD